MFTIYDYFILKIVLLKNNKLSDSQNFNSIKLKDKKDINKLDIYKYGCIAIK